MLVLGIETSCDETSAAVVNGDGIILSNEVLIQIEQHQKYGGIVPELAARGHLQHLHTIITQAMTKAKVKFENLDAIAATAGPGLIGGLLVGVMTGKAIANVHKKPFIGINHLAGHALTPRLTEKINFPYLLLLVSGGHCQLLVVKNFNQYHRLGTTVDDALGEAFDKTAKMVGLNQPGGPAIEKAAKGGNPNKFDFPRPMIGRSGCNFSFSGLKTAVRTAIKKLPLGPLKDKNISDLSASFQLAAIEAVVDRTKNALEICKKSYPNINYLVISGGVAANALLRNKIEVLSKENGFQCSAPPIKLCTDNGAMIAWAALERLNVEAVDIANDDMLLKPRPRWPLDPDAAPAIFAGVKA